ncbi:MAG: Peptidase [Flaviaesturariibacter sp.]|nr:Peptidase [Flaviaesturariibacter sp.]
MRKFLKILAICMAIIVGVFFFYFNNTSLVSAKSKSFYMLLKDSLRNQGFDDNLLVVSTKRFKWHNNLQVKFAGAASKSRHLKGDALDFLVFDINEDGISNGKDVDIVYAILDKKIIKDQGGIGTYKMESGFWNRQMIHIDSRGKYARWKR